MKVTFVGETRWERAKEELTSAIREHLFPVVHRDVVVHFPKEKSEPHGVEPMDGSLEESGAFHLFLFGRFLPGSDLAMDEGSYRRVLKGLPVGFPIFANGGQTPIAEWVGNVVCLRLRMRYSDDAPHVLWEEFVRYTAEALRGVLEQTQPVEEQAQAIARALTPRVWEDEQKKAQDQLDRVEREKAEALERFRHATEEVASFATRVREQMQGTLEVGEFQAELDRLRVHPLFEDAYCVQNGDPSDADAIAPAFVVRTREIIVSVKSKESDAMEQRRIGRFEIHVPLDADHGWGNNVHFTNLDRVVANQQGPHIDDEGWPCFGTGEATVDELYEQGRIAELVEFCLHYLTRVNTDDDWGENIHKWPLAEEVQSSS